MHNQVMRNQMRDSESSCIRVDSPQQNCMQRNNKDKHYYDSINNKKVIKNTTAMDPEDNDKNESKRQQQSNLYSSYNKHPTHKVAASSYNNWPGGLTPDPLKLIEDPAHLQLQHRQHLKLIQWTHWNLHWRPSTLGSYSTGNIWNWPSGLISDKLKRIEDPVHLQFR